jgi:hypothetical protein
MATTYLYERIVEHSSVLDPILSKDIQLARTDDSFFVVEDVLAGIMAMWSRDDWIRTNIPELVASGGKETPNGCFPFVGISCYALPFCYFHCTSETAYLTFRQMYKVNPIINKKRFFYNLHTPSLQASSLPPLCALFENLVKERDSALYYHLAKKLAIPPLKIAYRWILYAFVGVLDIEQVMLLWDRMIGYGEVYGKDILSIAAASIILFRRDLIMEATCEKDVKALFNDLSNLKVIPLIQEFLFSAF